MTLQTLTSFFLLCGAQFLLDASATSGCSKDCSDVKLVCQPVRIISRLLIQHKTDLLTAVCDNPIYSLACPASCKKCVRCPEDAKKGSPVVLAAPAAVQAESAQSAQSASTPNIPVRTTRAATTTPGTTIPSTMASATTTPAISTPPTTTPATTTPATTTSATATLATTIVVTTTKPTTPTPIDPLPIGVVTFSASKSYGSNYTIQKALDGDVNTIYHSANNGNVFAKFYIPKSRVTTVKVQNRADCCGERMTGEIVEVCDGDAQCVECGAFPVLGNGEWGIMTCGGDQGIEGNVVKITSPATYLQISEIEISGQAEEKLKKMDILRGSSSGDYSKHGMTYKLSNSFDNNDKTFFHSSGELGLAKYEIEESDVTLVSVQNCCADILTNAKVYVCSDATDASCTHCGTFSDWYGKKDWAVMTCGGRDGIQGRFVKVQSSGSVLQITEIEIFAKIN